MEGRLEATRSRSFCCAPDAVGEPLPAVLVETDRAVRCSAAGEPQALRRTRVGEDSFSCRSVGSGEELERLIKGMEVVLPMLWLAEPDRNEAAGKRQRVAFEPLPHGGPVTEISGRPQFRAVIVSPGNRRQDTLRIGHVRQDTDGDLEGTVAARRIRDAYALQP